MQVLPEPERRAPIVVAAIDISQGGEARAQEHAAHSVAFHGRLLKNRPVVLVVDAVRGLVFPGVAPGLDPVLGQFEITPLIHGKGKLLLQLRMLPQEQV